MHNFYTSEILVLPKNLVALETAEKLSGMLNVVHDYLAKKNNFAKCQNITFFNQELANFPIEEVRRMQTEAGYNASLRGQESRVFVLLNFDSASTAAQNAALKIVEESPPQTLILLTCFNAEKILPTIVSRCVKVSLEQEETKKSDAKVMNFSWPKNYSQAITLAEQNKDRYTAISLVEQLLKTTSQYKKKQLLLQCYQDLNSNQNVQLTLEKCFFSLVSLES